MLPGAGICESSNDMDYGNLLFREEIYMLQNQLLMNFEVILNRLL